MTAEDHLRNVIKNLNTHEHWTNELHCAVRDAEAFLDREEISMEQATNHDLAVLLHGEKQP